MIERPGRVGKGQQRLVCPGITSCFRRNSRQPRRHGSHRRASIRQLHRLALLNVESFALMKSPRVLERKGEAEESRYIDS